MYTLRQYLLSLTDLRGLSRTLGEAEVCRNKRGGLCYSLGNSAVVFRVRCAGRDYALRCFRRPMHHLREIYGEQLLERELYLYDTPDRGEWVDVVLCDWVEGITLSEAVAATVESRDRNRLGALSAAFDALAAGLVADDWAHGDLKPENILVDAAGALHLIDFDGCFLPAFAHERSPELGTAAFQHPARTAADFDARLDDFPAALISTALYALQLAPELYDRYRAADGLLFTPSLGAADPALHEVLSLFESRGEAVHYRIARSLASPTLALFGLGALLDRAVAERQGVERPTEVPELFTEGGLWGYRTKERTVIPPLYDCGFDFTEGLAAVKLGRVWHYIDLTGRTVLSCPGCEAVKPFHHGRAQIIRDGHRMEIDARGMEFVFCR